MIRKRSLLPFFTLVFLFSVALQAGAQSKVGYVDSQEILASYTAALDAQKKLEAESAKWGEELQKMHDEYELRKERLEQQSLLLSDEKKSERVQELDVMAEKIRKFQNDKWGEQGEYFKKRDELLKPVFDAINDVIATIAEDEKYDYILDTVGGNVLYANDKYNITDDVILELEKEAPTESSNSGR